MKHRIAFAILLILGISALARTVLTGIDENGTPMKWGSGWDGDAYSTAAVVFDDGTVVFMAPMPDIADAPSSPLRGAYAINPFDNSPSATKLCSGYDELAYTLAKMLFPNMEPADYATSCQRIAAADKDNIYVLRADTGNGTITCSIVKATGQRSDICSLDTSIPFQARLSVSGNNTILGTGNLNGTSFFYGPDMVQLLTLTAGDGFDTGFSADGNEIYYAAYSQDKDAKALNIYSYDRTTGKSSFIVQAGNPAQTGVLLQNGAEISSAAQADAFTFVTNSNSLLDDSGTDYINTTGPQVILAHKQENGTWEFTWCTAPSPLHKCSNPQVSADGRYVVFSAYPNEQDALAQIYRYDSQSGTMLNISTVDGIQPNADCISPAISPNGRYISFVTAATNLGLENKNGYANVYTTDLGPVFQCKDVDLLPDGKTAPLPVLIEATGTGASVSFSWDGTLPGKLFYLDNEHETSIENGASISTDAFPVYFSSGAELGSTTVKLTLLDGACTINQTSTLSVVQAPIPEVSHLSYVEEDAVRRVAYSGGYSLIDGSFSSSLDGTTVAFTTKARAQFQTYSNTVIKILNTGNASFTLIEKDNTELGNVMLSGNGKHLYYSDGTTLIDRNLESGTEKTLGFAPSQYAVSFNGNSLAMIVNGNPCIYADGELSILSEDNNYSSPMISYDGQSAAFLHDGALMFWSESANDFRQLATDITWAAMGLSGGRILAVSRGNFKWIYSDGSEEPAEFKDLPEYADIKSLQMSNSCRFLTYLRKHNGTYQAFRYDIATEIESPVSIKSDNTYANAAVNTLLDIGSGCVIFATSATNMVSGKTSSLSNELYKANFTKDVNTASTPASDSISIEESQTPTVIALQHKDIDGDDAIAEIIETSSGISSELMPPDFQNKCYSVKITPISPHLCGTQSLSIRFFDGTVWSKPYTITIQIKNVNDAPFWKEDMPESALTCKIQEGTTSQSIDFSKYADDYDLYNPAPYNDEVLDLSLENAPNWCTMKDGIITMTPGYDVTTRGNTATVPVTIKLQDKAGLSSTLDITIEVSNKNQAPEIQTDGISLIEGTPLEWDALKISDKDTEDAELLKVKLSAPAGKWLDKDATAITGPVGKNAFPITFLSAANQINTVNATAFALDGESAQSENLNIQIKLKKVSMAIYDIWPELGSGSFTRGWHMLAAPFQIDSNILSQLFNTDIWIWNGASFIEADEILESGRGFMVFLSVKPANTTIKGERGESFSMRPGWNLVGNTIDEPLDQSDIAFKSEDNKYKFSGYPDNGKAVWIFRRH